jgi:hypothetical protein
VTAPLWLPKYYDYRDALLAADSLTEDDLLEAVVELPNEIRDRLAEGPLPYRYDCGVCEAFGKAFYKEGAVDLADPMWRVWIYHETPKARMKRVDQQHYGPLANECYERTLATYRAAGWPGEAPEPNA